LKKGEENGSNKAGSEYFKPEDAEGMANKGLSILEKGLGIIL